MSDAEWDLVIAVHMTGAYSCSKAVWPHFRAQKYGRIINTASAAGLYGNLGQANYSAAKMGLVAFTKVRLVMPEQRIGSDQPNRLSPSKGQNTASAHPALHLYASLPCGRPSSCADRQIDGCFGHDGNHHAARDAQTSEPLLYRPSHRRTHAPGWTERLRQCVRSWSRVDGRDQVGKEQGRSVQDGRDVHSQRCTPHHTSNGTLI